MKQTPQIKVTLNHQGDAFVAKDAFAIKDALKSEGWHYHQTNRTWQTKDTQNAQGFRGLMDAAAKAKLDNNPSKRNTQSPNNPQVSHEDGDFDFALEGPVDEDTNACPPEEPEKLRCSDCGEEYNDGQRHTCLSDFEKWIAEDADPC